jgi:ankyrin repeat protein
METLYEGSGSVGTATAAGTGAGNIAGSGPLSASVGHASTGIGPGAIGLGISFGAKPLVASSVGDGLPNDVPTLQNIIIDLNRRLQNANHTVESLQQRYAQMFHTAELYRTQVSELSNALRLEISKNTQLSRNKLKDEESASFEKDRKKVAGLQEEIRLAIIDQAIKGSSRESNKIIRMRTQLTKLESRQESQSRLLKHLNESDNLAERLAVLAQNGDFNACLEMLQQGVSCNEVDKAGFLPLHYACSNGHVDVARLLLEFGADCSCTVGGSNPVETAAAAGFTDIIGLLIEFGGSIHDHGPGGAPPIVVASGQGHLNALEYLLEMGANINAVDANNNNSLHAAARIYDGSTPLIALLLSLGCNIRCVNSKGLTPLHLALNLNNIEAIEAFGGRNRAMEEINAVANSTTLPLSPVNLKKLQAGLSMKTTASYAASGRTSGKELTKLTKPSKPSKKAGAPLSKKQITKKVGEFAQLLGSPELLAPPPDNAKDDGDDDKSDASSITFRGEEF